MALLAAFDELSRKQAERADGAVAFNQALADGEGVPWTPGSIFGIVSKMKVSRVQLPWYTLVKPSDEADRLTSLLSHSTSHR